MERAPTTQMILKHLGTDGLKRTRLEESPAKQAKSISVSEWPATLPPRARGSMAESTGWGLVQASPGSNTFDRQYLSNVKQDISRIIKSIKHFCNDNSSLKEKITIQVINDLKEKSEQYRSLKLMASCKFQQPDSIVIQRLQAFNLGTLRRSLNQPRSKAKVNIPERVKKDHKKVVMLPPGAFFDLKVNFTNRVMAPSPSRLRVFVGQGNNGALVKHVLRRRKKITIVSNIQSANFVWTQLPQYEILEAQHRPGIFQEPSQACSLQPVGSGPETAFRLHPDSKFMSQTDFRLLRERWRATVGGQQGLAKLKQQLTPHLRILSLKNLVVTNHLCGSDQLGDKKSLFRNLKALFESRQEDVFSVVPRTFWISNLQDPSFRRFRDETLLNPKQVWIVKPGENSNRGSGIFLAGSQSQLVRQLKFRLRSHSFVIQQYISRPLLFNQRKFDIRHFVLVTSVNGRVKGYWYTGQGYIRTSSRKFSLDSLDDLFMHLTNDAIQKHCDSYGLYEPGNKISYPDFQKYLAQKHPGQHLAKLLESMKGMAKSCLEAVAGAVDQHLQGACNFQLFGLDFMVDCDFRPWLIEVNTNPCLQANCAVLSKAIPKLLDSLFRFTVDPLFGLADPTQSPDLKFQLLLER